MKDRWPASVGATQLISDILQHSVQPAKPTAHDFLLTPVMFQASLVKDSTSIAGPDPYEPTIVPSCPCLAVDCCLPRELSMSPSPQCVAGCMLLAAALDPSRTAGSWGSRLWNGTGCGHCSDVNTWQNSSHIIPTPELDQLLCSMIF